MAASIGERLERGRAAMFVGRAAELAAIDRLLAEGGERRFVYLTGPGGIGKTELLHAAAREAAARGRKVIRIDGRSRSWTAGELAAAIAEATTGSLALILLDSFEAVAHLESFLRTECLPALPDHARVVAAGRVPLASAWREDSGWCELSEMVQLGPLTVSESADLLVRRGIPAGRARRYAAEIPGHPLTIALLSEVLARDHAASSRIDRNQPIARALIDKLLAELAPAARRVLEAASLVHLVTEPMLARLLDQEDVRLEFDQLRRWSFVDATESALKVHDVVRTAIAADLAALDSQRYAMLLLRAARYYQDAWRPDLGADEGARLARDTCHLLGHVQRQLAPRQRDDLIVVPVWPSAWPAIEAMVMSYEGPESLAALQYWRAAGCDLFVCRDDDERVLGFQSVIPLDRVSEAQAARDPGTLPLWRLWRDTGVLRAGRARFVRHWMASEGYQTISPVQAAFFTQIGELMASSDTAGMAQAFADVAAYDEFSTDPAPRHVPEVDFMCDGRRHGCMVRDYLKMSSAEVYRRLLASCADIWKQMAEAPAPRAPELASRIGRAAFERAVREALRSCDRVDLLDACELRRTRWGADAAAVELRDRLRDEVRRLFTSPRDAVLDDVLERTYFRPGPKQRAIADDLGLSYGTYRRHLATATERLVHALWAKEAA